MANPDSETTGSEATDSSVNEAFGLVGNEIRADILRALGETTDEETSWRPLTFSELRSRVNADVDSSKFNYHLQQLVGQFVTKDEEGYRLRPEGTQLYRTVKAGTFTRQVSREPFAVGLDCYDCGGAVEARYDDGVFEIGCPDCERVYDHVLIPPSAVEGASDDELLDRVDQYTRHRLQARSRGVCPNCVNSLDADFVEPEELDNMGFEQLDVLVHRPCDHCGATPYMSVGLSLLHHPDLVAFCHERGFDVTHTPIWELEFATTDRYTTVRSTDPWEVALELTVDGDTLELVVDEELTVVETNRP